MKRLILLITGTDAVCKIPVPVCPDDKSDDVLPHPAIGKKTKNKKGKSFLRKSWNSKFTVKTNLSHHVDQWDQYLMSVNKLVRCDFCEKMCDNVFF